MSVGYNEKYKIHPLYWKCDCEWMNIHSNDFAICAICLTSIDSGRTVTVDEVQNLYDPSGDLSLNIGAKDVKQHKTNKIRY